MTGIPQHGVIVAPAGHGKTHYLSEILDKGSRCLVLTHTNVAAGNVRTRAASRGSFRIETIDSLAKRLTGSFPGIALLSDQATWVDIRHRALEILKRPAIRDALGASYEQVIVDEYQDCSSSQAAMVQAFAGFLPTLVLGDPMQSIFDTLNRHEPSLAWEDKVGGLPSLQALEHPWRWNSNRAHGQWVVKARQSLLESRPVALNTETARSVTVANQQGAFLSEILKNLPGATAVISGIANRPGKLSSIAKMHRWNSAEVAELSEPKELITFANNWDSGKRLFAVLTTAKQCFTNCTKVPGFEACMKSAATNTPTRSKTELAAIINTQTADPVRSALQGLRHIAGNPKTGLYRPDLLNRVRRCLRALGAEPESSMATALEAANTQIRLGLGRTPSGPLVGTVLRLKGLEFDHVVIVDEHEMEGPEEVYVALSRAKKSVTVVREAGTRARWFI